MLALRRKGSIADRPLSTRTAWIAPIFGYFALSSQARPWVENGDRVGDGPLLALLLILEISVRSDATRCDRSRGPRTLQRSQCRQKCREHSPRLAQEQHTPQPELLEAWVRQAQ